MINPTLSELQQAIRTDHDPDMGTVYCEIGKDGAIASASGDYEDADRFVLTGIAVVSERQHQGIGGVLFRHMVGFAINNGFKTLESDVNNEFLAKLIARAFPPVRLTINQYDGSEADPYGTVLDGEVAQALFAQYRSEMPEGSGPSDMLNDSIYYTADLR